MLSFNTLNLRVYLNFVFLGAKNGLIARKLDDDNALSIGRKADADGGFIPLYEVWGSKTNPVFDVFVCVSKRDVQGVGEVSFIGRTSDQKEVAKLILLQEAKNKIQVILDEATLRVQGQELI
jgi:hypothetical protein